MDGEGPRALRRAVLLVGGVWLTLAAAIWMIWAHVLQLDTALGGQRFGRDVDELQHRLTERMTAYEVVLRGGAGLFFGHPPVTRAQWGGYVAGLALDRHYPGLQGLGYAEAVSLARASAFEQQVRAEGFPTFHISPAGRRSHYVVVKFLEPFNWRNQRALGFDGYAEATRRAAMDRARDTGDGGHPGAGGGGGRQVPVLVRQAVGHAGQLVAPFLDQLGHDVAGCGQVQAEASGERVRNGEGGAVADALFAQQLQG